MTLPGAGSKKRFWDDRNDLGRLSDIDGLRALAVLSVMLFHARVHFPGIPLGFFKEGTHGVDLFFVLSGFCLALPTLERLQRAGAATFDLTAFAGKRVFRILPPYFAAVALFAAAGAYVRSRGFALPEGMNPTFDWYDVGSELLFMDRGLHHINQSFWSLAVEFRWYFVFPFALALWTARPRALLAVAVAAIFASEMTRASSTDLGVIDAFLLGIVAAQARLANWKWIRFAPVLCLVSVMAGLALETSYHFPIQTNSGWHLAAFFFVVSVGSIGALRRFFSNPLLTTVGVASYSIYLVHEPIVSATVHAIGPRFGFWPAAGVAISLGLAAGALTWACVERPITDRVAVGNFLRAVQPVFARCCALAGLPTALELQTASRPETAATRLPEASAVAAAAGIGSGGRDLAAEGAAS